MIVYLIKYTKDDSDHMSYRYNKIFKKGQEKKLQKWIKKIQPHPWDKKFDYSIPKEVGGICGLLNVEIYKFRI